ncbi:MAG: methylmalonyl-CoA epimerase [Acidobacteriota bacterium]
MSEEIDHIGIAVRSLDVSLAFYCDVLQLQAGDPEIVASEGVRVVFLRLGSTRIELLEPLEQDSAVARFIRKRGEGIHHICLLVDDLEEYIASLEARGARIIPPRIRPGARGHRIAFVHPRSTCGVLLELKERVIIH